MYTLYKINSDELNENFIAVIKAHATSDHCCSISEVSHVEQDETAYLLANPANKAQLLAAIAQVDNNQLIDVD
jgi:PHD/YefM family antitoxin component YafN of YafNO toxin-antitoxin module